MLVKMIKLKKEKSNGITSLNADCMEYIFNHLELNDLLSVAETSKMFREALNRVFKRKFINTHLLFGENYK